MKDEEYKERFDDREVGGAGYLYFYTQTVNILLHVDT